MEGLPDYEAKITVEENLLSEKRLHLETLNERASDLRTNLNTVNNELKKCQSRLINVQKLDSEGVCPECERPLGEHKPQLVSKYNDEIAISIEKQNALNESLTTLGSQITEKKSEISVVESRIAELKELVVERERKIDLISQLKERVATLEATIGQANSDITALGEITFDQQQLDTALSSQEDIKSRYDKYNTKLGRVASLEATKQEKLDQMSILKNFGTILESLKKEQQDVGFSEEEVAKVKTALEDISTVIEKVTETIHSEEKDLSEQKSKIENYTRELEKDSTHREQYSRMERMLRFLRYTRMSSTIIKPR